MSERKFEMNCNKFKLDATVNLFSKLNCQENYDSKDDFFVSASDKFADEDKSLKLELEQVQRRQSIVYENAQEKVAALETLLKTVDPSWSKRGTLKPPTTTTAQHCPPPQAYHFKDIYELKKQELLRQNLEQERNQRQFHSRPMPNFRHVHQQQANKQIVHRITRPVTPNVLKTSRQMLLKRSQKVEQLIQQRELEQQQELMLRPKTKPVPKFNVIPLKPNNGQSSSQFPLPAPPPKPFRLSTGLRAEQRKRFNAQSQQMQENRRREQEEQRKKQEHQAYQKQRLLATFRARPNPFRPQL